MKISELKATDLNCEIFSVYDYDGLSLSELLCEFFAKINECVKVSNDTLVLADWLVNKGLSEEVAKQLNVWLTDGTLTDLINVELFGELNDKIIDVGVRLDSTIADLEKKFEDRDFLTNGIEVNVLQLPGVVCNGINDDSIAINQVIEHVKGTGITLKFPSGNYLCKSPIKLLGVKIKGDFGSPFANDGSDGTVFNFNGGHGFVHDDTTGNKYITNHIEGVSITNCDTAIMHTYQVQSTFKNIHITNCRYGLRVGDVNVLGALFCYYENIYVKRASQTALVINGKDFNNSHVFTGCQFFGTYGAYVSTTGGYGALNIMFNSCEFGTSNMGEDESGNPLGRRGCQLVNARQTVFNSCYFENPSASVILTQNSDCTLNNCTFGSHSVNNLDKDESVIIGRSDCSFIQVNQGFVETSSDNMKYLTQHDGVDGKVFVHQPVRLMNPTMALSKNSNYNVLETSKCIVASKGGAKMQVKGLVETDGYEIHRALDESTGFDDGVKVKLGGEIIEEIYPTRVSFNVPVQMPQGLTLFDNDGNPHTLTIENNQLCIR